MPDSPALCGNLASCAAITSLGPRGQKPAFTTFEQAPAATGVPTAGAGWLTGQQRVGKLETAHGRYCSRAVRRREGGTSRRHLALNDSASCRAQPSDTNQSDYLPCITLARDGRIGGARDIVAIDQSRNGSGGSAKMAQFLAAANTSRYTPLWRVARTTRPIGQASARTAA